MKFRNYFVRLLKTRVGVLAVNPLLGIDRTISFISPAVDGATKKHSSNAGGMQLMVLTLLTGIFLSSSVTTEEK